MYRNEFDKLLASGKIPRAVILYGECDFLLDLYLEKYIKSIPSDLSELRLYYNEYSLDVALSHLSSASLFDGGNLLVVKYDKKLDAKNINALLDQVEKDENNYFILQYQPEENKDAIAKAKYFEKRKFPDVRFFIPTQNEAKNILKELATSKGINLDSEALDLILKLNDYNLSLASTELEKLQILDEITLENIENIIAGHLAVDPFRIIYAIINKEPFWHMIENLYLNGVDEYDVTIDIQKALFQLFGIFAVKKLLGSEGKSKDFLGFQLPPKLDQERSNMAIRLTQKQYTTAFETLSKLELALKSKKVGDKQAILHSYLIKLQREI